MESNDLKDFISSAIAGLSAELNRVSVAIKEQSLMIREIEIKSTTRVAELQKDIEEIRRDIVDIKSGQKDLNDSQKFKWKTLSETRAKERDEAAKKEASQAVINDSIKTINKLLWLIIGIVLSIGFAFVWDLIVHGGIRGIGP